MPEDPKQRIIDYYHTRESLWGYPLVLGGAKHFGYYPPEVAGLSMRQALRIMEDVMGRTIGLPPSAKVLDAGSGMGRVAVYLAKHFGYQVEGIDLLEFNVNEARRFSKRSNAGGRTNFHAGDYSRLPFADRTFDAVYTMETLVHAPDFRATLAEFRRVLKPGGRLVLFEYTITPYADMEPGARRSYQAVIEGTAMHALPEFAHDSFPGHLSASGFTNPVVIDATDRMLPMWRRFNQLAMVPYTVLKRTGVHQSRYINTVFSIEWFRYRQHFRYNLVTARKPER
jgi:ubiquinone/menaquinone biosynthesis C-methylase UbiE